MLIFFSKEYFPFDYKLRTDNENVLFVLKVKGCRVPNS